MYSLPNVLYIVLQLNILGDCESFAEIDRDELMVWSPCGSKTIKKGLNMVKIVIKIS